VTSLTVGRRPVYSLIAAPQSALSIFDMSFNTKRKQGWRYLDAAVVPDVASLRNLIMK